MLGDAATQNEEEKKLESPTLIIATTGSIAARHQYTGMLRQAWNKVTIESEMSKGAGKEEDQVSGQHGSLHIFHH